MTSRSKSLILLASGMAVIALSQIVSHYFTLSDMANGAFIGLGFGILLVSVMARKFKTA